MLKKDISSVEISFTHIDISLDYSEFGISFELSGNSIEDFSFDIFRSKLYEISILLKSK